MFDPLVSWLLTAIFASTGVFCLVMWVGGRHGGHGDGADGARLVHANHALMSVAMLVMVWRPSGTAGSWVQVAVFAALGVALGVSAARTPDLLGRTSWISHLVLNAAMVWMLAAMPMLMGHAVAGSDGDAHAGHDHGGHGSGGMDLGSMAGQSAPGWAAGVNGVAIAAGVVVAVWWLVQAATRPGHRLHSLCHALMGAGMAIMLAAM